MFSLIIAVMSIALVTVLTLATYYLLGGAFTDAEVKARATTLQTQAQQVEGAAATYQALNGQSPQTLEALITAELLRDVPTEAWATTQGTAVVPSVPNDVCLMFNQQRGINTVPLCTDPVYALATVCCIPGASK